MTEGGALAFVVVSLALVVLLRRALRNKTLDLSRFAAILGPLNAVRFRLRRTLRLSRAAPPAANEPKEDLFRYLAGDPAAKVRAEARATLLEARYDLATLAASSTRAAYRENLYVLELLDAHVPAPLAAHGGDAPLVAVDVGSKDFVYASALAAFVRARSGGRATFVHGVEIDGHVVYRDLTTRDGHARAHAALAGEAASYHVMDFLGFEPAHPAALVTMFFPFVTRFALLQWGLPPSEYRPEELLAHAARMLAPDGVLVVVNHTREERDALTALAARISGLLHVATADVASTLVDYWDEVPERTITIYRAAAT